ncbi:MAG: glycosyltransferase [Paludibacteraceae bacterium]|nr:glycosyltransferase [Paludibacteraceae bacterium]
MAKVSVIIPVYNASKYIDRCVVSLFEQTLDDIEYIFVDDCSTDDSIELIKKRLQNYPLRISQVRFLRTPQNSGQGLARKIGMQAAQGEYMIHCDSDDWVDKEMYQVMYDRASESNSDIVVCNYISESENTSIKHSISYKYESPKEIIKFSYMYGFHGVLWNKMVRTSIFSTNSIYPYDGINVGEDYALMVRAFVKSNSLVKIDDYFYHYNVSNVNATTNLMRFSDKVCEQSIKKAELLKADFESYDDYEEYDKFIHCHCYMSKMHILRGSFSDIKWFNKEFPQSDGYAKYINAKGMSKMKALRLILVRNHLSCISILFFKLASSSIIFKRS